MPTTPYAKLLLSINAGPPQDGGITASPGDTVQPSAESTAQWDLTTPPRWEIYAYPPGWTGPASGWVTESVPQPGGGTADVYIYLGLGPPPAFALPALPMWGKFLLRLTVQGGLLNGRASEQLVDNMTAVQTIGPNGLFDVAVGEEGQFDTARSWVGGWQEDLRLLDATLAGSASPYAALPTAITIGAGAIGGVNQYAQGDHEHPVTVGTPGTITIGAAAAAGGGTALAGALHVHALPAPTVVSGVSSSGSLGASAVPAREDHAHALSFTTVNSLLALANAPITVNGQTITAGGFIGPYFSTNAANPATMSLLRAANGTSIIAARNAANSGDLDLLSTSGDSVVLGSSSVASHVYRAGTSGTYEWVTDSAAQLASLSETQLYFNVPGGTYTIDNEGQFNITAIGGTDVLNLNNQAYVRPEAVQFFISSLASGGGTDVLVIGDASVEPTNAENGTSILWTSNGTMKGQSKSHLVATLAPRLDSGNTAEDVRAYDRRATRVHTTDATLTDAITFTMPDNTIARMTAEICALYGGDSGAGYTIKATVKRFLGNALMVAGSPTTIDADEDNAAFDATIAVSGNDAIVRVQGVAATNVEWLVALDVLLLTPA